MGLSAAIIHRQTITRAQLSSLYWLNIGTGCLLFGAVVAVAPLAARLFAEPPVAAYLACAAGVFPVSAVGAQFQALLEKELDFRLLAIQEIAGAATGAVLTVGLTVLGYGVWALVWGYLAAAGLRSLMLAHAGWKRWRPELSFRREEVRGFLSFGLYQVGERCINYVNFRVDQFAIGTMLGAQALGYYVFAFGLVIQPQSRINPVVTRVAFPIFSKVQDDEFRLRRGYLSLSRSLAAINAPLLLGLLVIAPALIPAAFGVQWTDAVPLVQLLALFALVRTTGNPIGSLLLARGRADVGFRWNVLLLLVTPPAVYAAALAGGLTAVAGTLVFLQLVLQFMAYRVLLVPLIGRCGPAYLRSLLIPISLAAIMAASVWSVSMATPTIAPLPALVSRIGCGVVIYGALMWVFDRESMREFVTLVRGESA